MTPLTFSHRSALALAALVFTFPAFAAAPTAAEATYRRDRAACLDGSALQARSSCLREAGAARAEARRGTLDSASAETLAANARKRCEVHLDADARQACERMANGEGQRAGSVAGGGVLRSLTTTVPASSPAASAPPAR